MLWKWDYLIVAIAVGAIGVYASITLVNVPYPEIYSIGIMIAVATLGTVVFLIYRLITYEEPPQPFQPRNVRAFGMPTNALLIYAARRSGLSPDEFAPIMEGRPNE